VSRGQDVETETASLLRCIFIVMCGLYSVRNSISFGEFCLMLCATFNDLQCALCM